MSEDQMLKCLIAFVLGFLVARMVIGNGFSIGFEPHPAPQTAVAGVVSACMKERCIDLIGAKGNDSPSDSGLRNWDGQMSGGGVFCAVQRFNYTGYDAYGKPTGGKAVGCWP
jgi:hypothetical protein